MLQDQQDWHWDCFVKCQHNEKCPGITYVCMQPVIQIEDVRPLYSPMLVEFILLFSFLGLMCYYYE